MRKISDPLYLGAIAGIVCTAVKEPIARYCINRGWAPYDGIQKGAGLVLEPYEIDKKAGIAVGILVDALVGGFASTAMSVLHTSGIYKMNPVKGALCGLGIWATWYGALGRYSAYQRTTASGALVSAGWHIIYGAVAGTVISTLGEQKPVSIAKQESGFDETTLQVKSKPIESYIH